MKTQNKLNEVKKKYPKCPKCLREFKTILDYPRIYIENFRQIKIPLNVKLPYEDNELFLDEDSESQNEHPPNEVLTFFKKHKKAKKYFFKGFYWIKTKQEWDSEYYYQRYTKDAKALILSYTGPYFAKLRHLIGKKVPVSELYPEFIDKSELGNIDFFNLPISFYDILLEEINTPQGKQMLKQNKIKIPKIKASKSAKKLAFVLTKSEGGTLSSFNYKACIGVLAWKGRTISIKNKK